MASFILLLLLVISRGLVASLKLDQFEDWTRNLLQTGSKQPQVDHLHFYFHDTVSGKTPTAVQIAQSPISTGSKTRFGLLRMTDDLLTEGSDPNSKLLGRAQGTYGSAGQNELDLIMSMSFGFLDGDYNGSSIVVLGRNAVFNPTRELPIIGGTGIFRLARGVAMARTVWFNVTSEDAVVEYNVTVVH